MSKFLAAIFVVARLVSGQSYSLPNNSITDAPISTTALITQIPTTTSMPTGPLDSFSADTSIGSLTTEIFQYCTMPTPAIGPFITIYNTVYVDVCPTGGLTSVTYTITDICGCQHETDYTRPTGCPSGFTVTEKTCTMCPSSPVITCTTPIGIASQTSNPTTGIAGGNQNSSLQNQQNEQNQQSQQSQQYTHSGSTPSSAPGTKPSYLTTSNAKLAASSSPLGIIMVMSMAMVAGLMCIL